MMDTAVAVTPDGNVGLYREWAQAIDDEQGVRLVGSWFNERGIAEVGIADVPGAYLVYRWCSDLHLA